MQYIQYIFTNQNKKTNKKNPNKEILNCLNREINSLLAVTIIYKYNKNHQRIKFQIFFFYSRSKRTRLSRRRTNSLRNTDLVRRSVSQK